MKKSQSKKIRDLLFRIWENTDKQVDQETFYNSRTEEIIKTLQAELRGLTEPPIQSYGK